MSKNAMKNTTGDDLEREVTLPRPKNDTASTRRCLRCEEPFESSGWHNRLCSKCVKRS